jgi:hypothetical protein
MPEILKVIIIGKTVQLIGCILITFIHAIENG